MNHIRCMYICQGQVPGSEKYLLFKNIYYYTSFCFRLIASRFVQKAQDVSKIISRRLGSSSSTGRDMIYAPVGRATKSRSVERARRASAASVGEQW